MENIHQSINTLAATLVELQARAQAAEQEAIQARQERQELADRIVASERSKATRTREAPIGSPVVTTQVPQLVDTRSIGKIPAFTGEREA